MCFERKEKGDDEGKKIITRNEKKANKKQNEKATDEKIRME